MPSALQTITGHEDIDLFDEGFGGRMRLTERYGRNPNPTAGSPRYDFKDLASAANDKTGWSGRSRPLSMPSIPSTLRPEQIDQEPGVSHLGDMQQTWYNTQPSSPTSSPNTGLYNGNPFASSSGICYDSMWSTTRAISYNSLGALSGVDEYRCVPTMRR
ncbi:uncharacterized protein LDX57_002858 [Aspergillus melleus]|uniref:uncharacterized protein n=1 Tax=Aspergillus melleus TaxID=138277 RepID=UPI001E8DF65B|nr:uncharacterized protein LDX57_002858 [Aspergillus melleus]KAH8425109.1 hypothetical protein LDX57_002858 [Aspergillus melleus]